MKSYDQELPSQYRVLQVQEENPDSDDLQKLILGLAEELDKLKPYHVSELYLHDYREVGGIVNLSAAYWLLDKEEIKILEDTNYTDESAPIISEQFGSNVQMFTIQMSQGAEQNNVSRMLREIVGLLHKYACTKLLDITLNDLEDEDARENPKINVYFLK